MPHAVLVYAIPSVTYSGEAQTPVVKVKDDDSGEILKAGKDYTVAFEDNVKAPEGKVVIDFIGDYAGVERKTEPFTINPATVTVTGMSAMDKVYDGNDTATVVGNPVLSGVIDGDDVRLGEVSVKVNVVDGPTKIAFKKSSYSVKKGKSLNLANKIKVTPSDTTGSCTWSSSDPGIATVSAKGVVKGVKKGTVTITVATANGKSAKVKVKVK